MSSYHHKPWPMSQNTMQQRPMTEEELRRYNYEQQRYNPVGQPDVDAWWRQQAMALAQPLPTTHYALRLSDEDVARIAEAVMLRLRAEADYPR